MKRCGLLMAVWLLLATLSQTASAGWGFSYQQGYAPRHHDHHHGHHHGHHHHYAPPVYAPYGGYVERHYYAPPPPPVYYAPPHRHAHPRGSIWIGF